MTASSPRRADASRNRAAVVEAAVELLSRHPEASMKEVAEASGLGRTTVYRHFPSREVLIDALCDEVFVAVVAALRAILAEHRDPLEVLPRVAEATLAVGERFQFLAAHRDVAVERARDAREDPLEDWIDEQLQAGRLRPLGRAWIQGMLPALVTAAHEEVTAGRATRPEATRKLGETLVGAFAAP